MKAAGLTHGAFYAHFTYKQELQEAAVAYGQEVSRDRAQSDGATKRVDVHTLNVTWLSDTVIIRFVGRKRRS
jgi:AcrR family transcriptional regulator